jgi:hypothetical protein
VEIDLRNQGGCLEPAGPVQRAVPGEDDLLRGVLEPDKIIDGMIIRYLPEGDPVPPAAP